MKQSRLFVLLLAICTVGAAWAQDVTLRQAEGIAADFFKSHGIKSTAPQKSKRRVAARQNGNSPYYIFNNSDESAFVIVSGDSRAKQVLAYSLTNAFNDDDIAPGAEYLLGMYEAYINGLQDGTVQPIQSRLSAPTTKVLETAKWNQNSYFWGKGCPTYNGNETPAGCTPTAMAILMRYYEWPKRGFGSKSYTTTTLGLNVSANFEDMYYDWASLPLGNESDPNWNDASKSLVAKILFHSGVAINTNYNVGGSSGSGYNAPIGLYRYFGYNLGSYIQRQFFSDEEWLEMIMNEIDNNNPLIYFGTEPNVTAHALVCDGYDEKGYLHFNFGWSGHYDAFWDFTSTTFRYHANQGFLMGVTPDYNASSRELYDMYLCNNGDSNNTGIRLYNTKKIYRGQFYIQAMNLSNISDKMPDFQLGVFICDKNGSKKLQIGNDSFTINNYIDYNFYVKPYVLCSIPIDYTFCEGDHICLFSSFDQGATWKDVGCYAPQLGVIKMADVYDPADLLMNVEEGKDAGLTLYTDNHIDLNGNKFWIQCNLLRNMLGVTFNGDVAAFLCDKYGNRKYQIGKGNVGTDVYKSGSRYGTFPIQCAITSDMNVESGDRICVFSRLNGYDWVYVDCEDTSKAYITIPEDLIAEKALQVEVSKFKADNSTILKKTINNVTEDDLAAIEKALSDYDSLSGKAKEALTSEKALLDAMKTAAEKDKADKEAAAEAERLLKAEVEKFKSDNSEIIGKNADDATEDDLAAIEKALADYDSLSDKAKAELAGEKARLDALKAKIDEVVVGIASALTNGRGVRVYTVNGTLVNGNATARDLKRLARGVYVINGKKVRVK